LFKKWYLFGIVQMTENIPDARFNPMTSLAKAVGPLDGRGNLPLYQELQRALRKAIDSRILGPDDALPSGAGNFVSARVDKNFAMLTSFSEDMRARGRTPRSVWLKRAAGTVTPEEALALRLSPGTPVFRFNRIRYADDAPMALEYATIVATALPSLEAVDTSLYEALERAGQRPVRALQRLRAVLLTGDQAELLKAKPGDAGLLVERLGSLPDGRAIEFSQSFYRGDTYDFVAELSAST
jgi:GntR family transcriptional regulator